MCSTTVRRRRQKGLPQGPLPERGPVSCARGGLKGTSVGGGSGGRNVRRRQSGMTEVPACLFGAVHTNKMLFSFYSTSAISFKACGTWKKTVPVTEPTAT